MVDHNRISNTLGKMGYYLSSHSNICVGVSGGSDSNIIVHMIATYFREYLPKIHFVFQNTGLEYRATLKHIEYMEQRYNISIERIRPPKGSSVVSVVRKDGIPIISKDYSEVIHYAQKGAQWALHRCERDRSESQYAFSKPKKELAKYLIKNGPTISCSCCDKSKKGPYHKYLKQIHADLTITGERRCEGGQRAFAHKDCFESGKITDKYMPLWFWDNDTKQYYKESEGIAYSDCYEVWGMDRTGCVGCPFNAKAGRDLAVIKKYEPNLYKACMNVFGESYRLMDRFNIHKEPILKDLGVEEEYPWLL